MISIWPLYQHPKVPQDYIGFCQPFWMMSVVNKNDRIDENQWNFKENTSNFPVSPVPTDGLAPLGAGTFVGKVMTKFGSCVYTPDWHLEYYL